MRILMITLFAVFPILLLSQTSGTMKGKVYDKDTGEELPFVNIELMMEDSTIANVSSDIIGRYIFNEIKPGKYDVKARFIGYTEVLIRGIQINANQTRFYDIKIQSMPMMLDEVLIIDYCVPLIDKDRTVSGGTVSRYSKSFNGNSINSESYDPISENEFTSPVYDPLSTFSIDVDVASYSNMRRFILEGSHPPVDAIRTEEMINYFSYNYPDPKDDVPFSVSTELGECPWNSNTLLLHIGVQGKNIEKEDLPPANLVFLLDVSGSMGYENKLPLLKKALRLLVNNLRKEDMISIVVYAGSSGLILEATKGDKKETILKAIDRLDAGGSTAGGEGILLAYKVARETYNPKANNRVILATDGDFNIGVTNDEALIDLIEKERDNGIFLSVLGFGTGNLKDSKMEKLADNGNGNYSYIDNLLEAKKVLVNEFGGTLYTIAKDVKIQLEFNPENVIEYRLIGYENRKLSSKDFHDDNKDAGEIGAGQSVTALYEIIPNRGEDPLRPIKELRYQSVYSQYNELNDELGIIKIRYKKPDERESKLIEAIVSSEVSKTPTNDFHFSAAVAEFGMLLRDSEYKGEASYDHIIAAAGSSKGKDQEGYRSEFIRLVLLARELQKEPRIEVYE